MEAQSYLMLADNAVKKAVREVLKSIGIVFDLGNYKSKLSVTKQSVQLAWKKWTEELVAQKETQLEMGSKNHAAIERKLLSQRFGLLYIVSFTFPLICTFSIACLCLPLASK